MPDDTNSNEKMVPESQLIAAKKGLQKKIDELQNSINELTKALDAEKKSRLLAESAKSALEEKLAEAESLRDELDKVKADLEAAQTSGKESSEAVLDLTRKLILATYNIEEEKLEGKTLEQLKSYQEVLEAVGAKREPGQTFDAGAGGTVDVSSLSPREKIKLGLSQREG